MGKKRLTSTGVAVVAAAVATAGLLVPAGMAHAATQSVMPLSAQGCASNTCILLSGNAGGTALIQGWAHSTTFTGTLRMTGPAGLSRVKSGTWKGGKGNFADWTVAKAKAGIYCVTGTSSTGKNEGTACETLS